MLSLNRQVFPLYQLINQNYLRELTQPRESPDLKIEPRLMIKNNQLSATAGFEPCTLSIIELSYSTPII